MPAPIATMSPKLAENSSIEWTDHTFNPWEGCTKVSPGCAHCYAETLVATRYGRVKWGAGQPRRRTSAGNWLKPLRWNREAARVKYGPRPRVFCASLADWLDDEVPIDWLADLLDLIRCTPNLDWLLLTKRPQNFFERQQAAMMYAAEHRDKYRESELINWLSAWWVPEGCEEGELHRPPANVWLGTTVEDQTHADERIPALLSIPAAVRFLSCEPLLGPISFRWAKWDNWTNARPHFERAAVVVRGQQLQRQSVNEHDGLRMLDWVIAGGESGSGARPMHPDWARALRDQCMAAGVPFLFKQWGEHVWRPTLGDSTGRPKHSFSDGVWVERVGKKEAGRLLDGRKHNEFPATRPQLQTA